VDLQPWAADPRTQLALVYEQAGDYEHAVEAIDEAISRSPDDYRLRLLAARMKVENGDNDGGLASLLEAERLNPRDPDIQAEVRRAS
jgi:Tfp pilus assembly protein PilF